MRGPASRKSFSTVRFGMSRPSAPKGTQYQATALHRPVVCTQRPSRWPWPLLAAPFPGKSVVPSSLSLSGKERVKGQARAIRFPDWCEVAPVAPYALRLAYFRSAGLVSPPHSENYRFTGHVTPGLQLLIFAPKPLATNCHRRCHAVRFESAFESSWPVILGAGGSVRDARIPALRRSGRLCRRQSFGARVPYCLRQEEAAGLGIRQHRTATERFHSKGDASLLPRLMWGCNPCEPRDYGSPETLGHHRISFDLP